MPRKDTGDIASGRLSAEALTHNFDDIAPPLDRRRALIAAQRCYYCYDAPCIQACPTGIDIPSFIKRITTDNLRGAAQDILGANILGGMCARVCPTEILCEGSCVRNTGESEPVAIGALQRYATDWVYDDNATLFQRAPDTGRRIAVVGAGPAGLSCAHALARAGHRVSIYDALPKAGGLNEYGIAAYKVPGFAQREIDWLLSIGGIEMKLGRRLGDDLALTDLRRDYDAVFLGLGLTGVNALGIDDEAVAGVRNAVDFIAQLRQTADLAQMPVGRRVVVIGGGNTAIDAAVQSKKLGAEVVTLVYRRGTESMSATPVEQAFAQSEGVAFIKWAQPKRIVAVDGTATGVEFEYTQLDAAGRLMGSGDRFVVAADLVLKAVGQALVPLAAGAGGELLAVDKGRIVVNADYETSLPGVYAGGDCVGGKVDLTVQSVEDGKRAAQAIHRVVSANATKAVAAAVPA
ncbi:NAD(P)-dependent oxidoreductase [Tahibacter soli]|uniref:dihydrouracil dehydrogenase (NAD(+)) n=1 Tax=Tahibacter soli TaxID=2983605 RepID=A0A9X3YQ06_9GAMM|nr:NAD(P)-dependent oxidoreductase [Tahibacter soli]MDC8016269.1 NAD(P)-dependent oxidoreductase [Tahibacter soli]